MSIDPETSQITTSFVRFGRRSLYERSISSPPVFSDKRKERRKFTLEPRFTGRQRRLGLRASRLTMRRASRETSSSSSLVNSLKSFAADDSVSLAPGTLTGCAPALSELPQCSRKNASPLAVCCGDLLCMRTVDVLVSGRDLFQNLLNTSAKIAKSSTLVVRMLRKLRNTSSRSVVSIICNAVVAVRTSAGVT